MNAYYVLLRQLMTMFLLITVFTMPLMFIYSSYSGLEDAPMYFANRFSIGNLGKNYNYRDKILIYNLASRWI